MITTAAIAAAVGAGLGRVATHLLDEGVIKPGLDPATEGIKKRLLKGPKQAQAKKALVETFGGSEALQQTIDTLSK